MARNLAVTALQEILTPHVDRIRRVLWPVWEAYERIPEDIRLQFDLTTEANALHDIAVANAKREFTGVPGVQIVEGSSFYIGIDGLGYGIDGQAACRIKKLDSYGHSRNYPTDRALGIRRNHSSALELEISDATVVDLGYVPDPLGAGFAKVQAIRVFDEAFILEVPREEGGAIPMPMPLHPAGVESGPRKRFQIASQKEKSGTTDPKSRK